MKNLNAIVIGSTPPIIQSNYISVLSRQVQENRGIERTFNSDKNHRCNPLHLCKCNRK